MSFLGQNSSEYLRLRDTLDKEIRRGKVKGSIAKQLAWDILQFHRSLKDRYNTLDVIGLLQTNSQQVSGLGVAAVLKALGILEVYGKNLLKTDRPPQWRIIRKSNPKYNNEVATINGSQVILRMMGYVIEVPDGLAFSDTVMVPDIPQVAKITSDILLLRQELLLLMKDRHPRISDFHPFLSTSEILTFQGKTHENSIIPQHTMSSLPYTNHEERMSARIINGHPPQSMPYFPSTGTRNSNISSTIAPAFQTSAMHNNSHQQQYPQGTEEMIQQREVLQSATVMETPKSKHQEKIQTAQTLLVEPSICDLCGEEEAIYKCRTCSSDMQNLCRECDTTVHRNPKRKEHSRTLLKFKRQIRTSESSSENDNGNILDVRPKETQRFQENLLNQRSFDKGDTNATIPRRPRESLQLSSSLTSKTITPGDWDQKVAELIDVGNETRRQQKANTLLDEIDTKISNYKRIIDEIRSKNPSADSLVSHVDEKIAELETIKDVVNTICNGQDTDNTVVNPSTVNGISENVAIFSAAPSQSVLIQSTAQEFDPNSETNFMKDPEATSFHPTEYLETSPHSFGSCSSNDPLPQTSPLGKKRKFPDKAEDDNLTNVNETVSLHTNIEKAVDTKTIDIDEEDDITAAKVINRNLQEKAEKGLDNASMDFSNGDLESNNFESALLPLNNDDMFFPFDGKSMGPSTSISMKMESPFYYQELIKKETLLFESAEMVDYMRSTKQYSPEQINVGIKKCNKNNQDFLMEDTPITWVKNNWEGTIQEVSDKMLYKGTTRKHIEEVVIECDGDVDKAILQLDVFYKQQAKECFKEENGERVLEVIAQGRLKTKSQVLATLQFDDLNAIREDLENEKNAPLQEIFIKLMYNHNSLHVALGYWRKGMNKLYYAEVIKAFWLNHNEKLNPDITDRDLIESIRNTDSQEDALAQLDKECMICTDRLPFTKITCMPTCGDNGCAYCSSCLLEHLKICIRDKNLRDITCPVCSNPNIDNLDETATNHFNFLDFILKNEKQIHELFQQKLRDFTLQRMDNFRWCSHCTGGFQFMPENAENLKMVCPYCQRGTCYKCKKPWELQHEGISCDQFQEWKEKNDPEFQEMGLARHLKENGIDCPDCKFRYSLAKGGCMHFKCTQCSHEFCSGCNSPFKQGKACNRFQSCAKKGLHAHHPRDCLFYLRDCNPTDLSKLLRMHNIPITIIGNLSNNCQVMEQKELQSGFKDAVCGRNVMINSGGLCELHYKEYLVSLVNKNHLDPAEIFDVDGLKACLMREEETVRQRGHVPYRQYKDNLLQDVKKLQLCHERKL